jgi:uncharacterized protein involved in exopolysaccharide biosynthesis/Mrp family chromosome partitioning ATPase
MSVDGHDEPYSVREQFGGKSPFGTAPPTLPPEPAREAAVRLGEGEPLLRDIPANQWYKMLDLPLLGKRVLRRSWLALIVALCGFAAGTLAARRLFTTSYGAQAVLLYRRDQEKRVRPVPGSAFALSPLSQNSVVKMIAMPEVLNEAIDEGKLGLSAAALAGRLEVRPEKSSEVIQLRLAGLPDGALAVRAVNALAQAAVRRNRDFYATQIRQMHDDFAARAKEAEGSLSAVDAKLKAFQEEHRFLEPQAEHQAYLEMVSAMSQRLSGARLELEALEVRIGKYKTLADGLPDQVVRESFEDNPLKRRLTNTEVALLQARTQYGPANPRVKELESEIEEMRKALSDKAINASMENVYERNPLKEQFRRDLLNLEAEREVAQQRVASLQTEMRELTARFEPMPARDLTYRSLLAERTIAEDFVNCLQRSTGDATLALQVDLADLEVIEPATAPGRVRSSLALLVAPVGAGMGAFGVLVLLLLVELADPRIRTARQLDLRYLIPCVAVVPQPRPRAGAAESGLLAYCRRLADVLPTHGSDGRRATVVGWTSAAGGEGVSRLCSEYATYMAERGLAVARVCWSTPADPTEHAGARLEAYLRDQVPFDALPVRASGVDVLSVSGPVADLPERAQSVSMRRLQDALTSGYDLVCLDLPAVSADPAAIILARQVDSLLVVVAAGRTHRGPLNEALERLREGGKRPFGFLLNHPGHRAVARRAAPAEALA